MENATTIYNYINKPNSEKVNRSLIFDKYLFWENYDFGPTLDLKKNDRDGWDRNFCKFEHFKIVTEKNHPIESEQYEQLKSRKNSLPDTISFSLSTRTRVIVNHGNESVLENSISIHPYYGFPVIPGSAIKGITRHFCNEFIKLDKALGENLDNIFGISSSDGESRKGCIVFLDAWPVNLDGELFETDVFTLHYRKYYQENELPKDNQDPNPVNFLAVKRGIKFEFAIAPSSKCRVEDKQKLLNDAQMYITEALKTFGIGAKTGSNYGYFK